MRRAWSESGVTFGDAPCGVNIELHKEGMQVTVFELEQSVRPVGILGDADNYGKSILDGLQPHKNDPEGGVGAFNNDRQVELLNIQFVGVPRKPKKPRRVLGDDPQPIADFPGPRGSEMSWRYDG